MTTVAHVAALSTIATSMAAAIAASPGQRRGGLILVLVACVAIWGVGAAGLVESTNESNPLRGNIIDNFLAEHLAFIPLYLALWADDRTAMFAMAMGAVLASAVIGTYTLYEEEKASRDALVASSHGILLAVVVLACSFAPGAFTRITAIVVELAYFFALRSLDPGGVTATIEVVAGVTLPKAEAPAGPSAACEPLCVEPGGDAELGCYAHNRAVVRVHERARSNTAGGLPDTFGMTAIERRCLRSQASGSSCTFCQDVGCVTSAQPGAVCTRSQAEKDKELAKTLSKSESLANSGFGVLTLDEQFAGSYS